uniref:Uncharacterized protein n=1 Tax=uncultured marine group II/III euryarchaeote KM3_180_D08 TaxID=1457942 RepID=A0A075GMD5_9EURY|nr:hypothetical protein [uncultured marine group II/III euryarchaeote KM3_180_D08]
MQWLLEGSILILTVTQLLMLYHCFQFRGSSASFADILNSRIEKMSIGLDEAASILEYMAEMLEENGSGSSGSNPLPTIAGNSIMDVLTQSLMSRVIDGVSHGSETETDSERQVLQGEFSETAE